MKISILGAHNSETRTARCMSLVIDDVLALDAGELTSSLSIPEQRKLKAILLTHQHYDHVRDIPIIALNLSSRGANIDIYSTHYVRDAIKAHLFNGDIYPKFHKLPEDKPAVVFNLVTPYKPRKIHGYDVLAVPVNHCKGTVGYQVSNGTGGAVFYTADTGPGLATRWKCLSPQMLFVDVTVPNRQEEFASDSGHLTPNLLGKELAEFRELKGYLPRVAVVHMDPMLEKELREEIAAVARSLGASIIVAREGMQLNI